MFVYWANVCSFAVIGFAMPLSVTSKGRIIGGQNGTPANQVSFRFIDKGTHYYSEAIIPHVNALVDCYKKNRCINIYPIDTIKVVY